MKQILKQAAVFVAVCAASAFIGWVSGYNFDERNAGVAMWVASTIVFAFAAGATQ